MPHLGQLDELVLLDALGALKDGFGDRFGGGTAIVHVVLDAKVCVRATRVMTRGEEDAAGRLAGADLVRDGRGREDAVAADDELLDAVTRGDLDNDADNLGRVVAAIAADDEGGALRTAGDSREDRLDKVLGVMLLLEDGDAVAQTLASQNRRAGEHRGRDCALTACGDRTCQVCEEGYRTSAGGL